MKTARIASVLLVLAPIAACDKAEPPKTASQPPRPIVAQASPTIAAPQSQPEVQGDFRLVKAKNSDSVFVLQDGKLSAVSAWGWVERNAPNKSIETISQQELESYPASGIIYK